MDYQEAFTRLKEFKQEHLLDYWTQLNSVRKEALLKQVEELNLGIFRSKELKKNNSFSPLTRMEEPSEEDRIRGDQLIAEGKVGCLLVAGGQGSRLRFNEPKGFYPVTLIKQKSLFQVFGEKTVAASKKAKRHLQLAIMTSSSNHEDTQRYFSEHRYFGLHPEQISFFMQGSLPLLNEEGQLFLETPGKIAEGPDGNGGSLERFFSSGIWERWRNQGIEYVNYVLIDNPLADPFDAQLIGHLHYKKSTVAIKAIERRDVSEKVGVLIEQKGAVQVIEYSEMPEEEAKALTTSKKPKYSCANISLFAFTMDFIKTAAEQIDDMPLHKAHKAVSYLKSDGKTELSAKPNAWKFERFIFDVLGYTQNVTVLIYKREDCFAPLKDLENLEFVKESLQKRDRFVLQQLVGTDIAEEPLELAQQFHYPTEELRKAWKGKIGPITGYIEERV